MKKLLFYLPLLFCVTICLGCQKESAPTIADTLIFETPVIKPVSPMISETSGIVDSKANPGFLWAQEDSGNPPELILLDHDAKVIKRIPIEGATNRDWEDITIAGDQLYIADIGDNTLSHEDYVIYQFAEPSASANSIKSYNTIHFVYSDGPHDAEAFLVDPIKKDIYIITKRDSPSGIYKLSYPQNFNSMDTATFVGSLTFSGVVSAAIDPGAKNVILKTYTGLHLFKRAETEDLSTALLSTATKLTYYLEPQGEAIAFAADNSGFYTLSEKGLSNAVNLYFYPKK